MNETIKGFHKIRKEEIKTLSELFAHSFYNDPLYLYFFPNEKKREKCAKYLFEYELRMSLNYAYANEDLTACFVYKKANDEASKVSPFFSVKLFFSVGLSATLKGIKYLSYSNKKKKLYKPENGSYLSLLCVDESLRNQGVAKTIISSFGSDIVYLETQNPVNVQIYKKIGFTLLGESKFANGVVHYCFLKRGI